MISVLWFVARSKVKLVWCSIFAFHFSFFAFRFSIFELSRKIVFSYSKSYFDIPTESENRISTFKILFWHSHWVGKSYFDIQNPILTFALSQKILFWYLKSYFEIRTESENRILTFKILFWHLHWVGKSFDIRTESEKDFECQNTIFRLSSNVKIGFWISK